VLHNLWMWCNYLSLIHLFRGFSPYFAKFQKHFCDYFFLPILFICVIKICLFFFKKKNHVFTSKMAAKVENFSLLAIFVSDFLKYCRLPSKLNKISYSLYHILI